MDRIPDDASLNRRQLLTSAGAVALGARFGAAAQAPLSSFKGQEVFEKILSRAREEGWAGLPIGERIGKIAISLLGTPYVGHTVELDDDREYCVVNLRGLDCVTFFEDSLDIARILRKRKPTQKALIDEVRFTRYRGGVQGDFTTRLHYTKEWIGDNVRKGVVQDLTPDLPGAEPFTQRVGFMSAHPDSYRQLKSNPDLIPAMREMERKVDEIQTSYLPLPKIAQAEHLLKTGDIVAVTTNTPGLDVAHTGLCYRDEAGVLRFLDASSKRSSMKVTLDKRLSEALDWSDSLTGVLIARPLEIANR
ncbi:MAG TPA: N-acetylmuramoyl-L-alanine amidase-like domain-containing protein [Fimbriimonas sp.]|nr:N-acetylmuramoyl-L-alanine amidase-like domain-containing protein [Fimbriimonas sp.]